MKYFIFLIVLGLASSQAQTTVTTSWDKSITNVVPGWAPEYFWNIMQIFPFAGACYIKDEFKSNKWPLNQFSFGVKQAFIHYDFPNYTTLPASTSLKALSTAIALTIKSQKAEMFTGIHAIVEPKGIAQWNTDLKKAGFPFILNTKGTKIYSAQAKYSKKVSKSQYWLARLVKSEKFDPRKMYDNGKSIGVTILRYGDTVSFTLVYAYKKTAYNNVSELSDYWNVITKPLGTSGIKSASGSKSKFALRDKIQKYGINCAESLTRQKEIYYSRKRPAFTHFRMISELQLMREYPKVLLFWLSRDKEFLAKSPHSKDIIKYLETAKSRKKVGHRCTQRDFCAWSFAYGMSLPKNAELENPVAVKLGKNGKIPSGATMDTNFFDPDYTMVMHKKWRAKTFHAKVYTVEHVQTNDWGSYDLIVNVFLRDKNPEVWRLLLVDDNFGINKFAMTTSKDKGTWRVTLLWYQTIVKANCTTVSQRNKASLGDENCLSGLYNFHLRREHDYNYTKGKKRRPPQGVTIPGDKPGPHDKPSDLLPKKSPRIPAFVPPIFRPNGVPVNPTTPNKTTKPKKPKVQKKDPVVVRKMKDKIALGAIKGNLAVRQVINLKKKYVWLDLTQ